MALDVDLLLDRRRLKRRLIVWRTLAVIACVIVVLTALRGAGLAGGGSAHLDRLSVSGIITEDRKLLDAIRASGEDKSVKALIVSINSPGGSVAGGEALYKAIAGVAEKKPVVAVMHGLAASAGYMIAMPAGRIFAHESTITGSIGVLMETGEVSGMLGKLGISAEAITSGPLKDQPSFTRPLTAAGRDALRAVVLDMYDMFVGMVATGRHMDPDAVRVLADGRVFTGRQAVKLGLVDAIGDEQDARTWLEKEKGISSKLPVEQITTASLSERMLSSQLSPIFGTLWKTLISQSVTLDLPAALWHP